MADFLCIDRVKETTVTTGTGTLTLAGAVTGYRAFSALDSGSKCHYCIEAVDANGVPTGAWEVGSGTYTLIGLLLSRDKIIASSNAGALVNFAAGTKNVFLDAPAAILMNHIEANGRLTLASGNSVYHPDDRLTPSSTSTGTDIVTFAAAHGWVSGTMVKPLSTVGGLTGGTTYYINAASATTCSFHTTVANALSGASKVDLTANITQAIMPIGISNTTIYYALHNGDRVCVPIGGGYGWQTRQFTELSLALGTITSGANYDVLLWDNAGTLTLQLGTAWTSDTARVSGSAGELLALNGRYVNKYAEGSIPASGGLYLGTIRTVSTTTTEDSILNRLVYNNDNKVKSGMRAADYITATWTYATATWRSANADSTLRCAVINGIKGEDITLFAMGTIGGMAIVMGIGEDTTSSNSASVNSLADPQGGTVLVNPFAYLEKCPALGYHYYQWVENAANGMSGTLYNAGTVRQSGITGSWPC